MTKTINTYKVGDTSRYKGFIKKFDLYFKAVLIGLEIYR